MGKTNQYNRSTNSQANSRVGNSNFHQAGLEPTSLVTFADAAHQTLEFDRNDPTSRLILSLIDTQWVQRLRRVSQTGNTKLVYMFAEHSRFGHCLGVAYLAKLLMDNLRGSSEDLINSYEPAVAAAALLHDIGHTAPGSHLAARIWSPSTPDKHELISSRVIMEDPEVRGILENHAAGLSLLVCKVLDGDSTLPPWTKDSISGGGWNADRGNWTIVDSVMCCVSYGRYNVRALLDAFRLAPDGRLVLLESRLDALTHFFVARDSMYRQVYQHRVLQAADALTANIVRRVRNVLTLNQPAKHASSLDDFQPILEANNLHIDSTMLQVLLSSDYATELELSALFNMTEGWWNYHLEQWCHCNDAILKDLSCRLRDRNLFKTVRLEAQDDSPDQKHQLIQKVSDICTELGYDPNYYVCVVSSSGHHRGRSEKTPTVLLDSGELVDSPQVEPLIENLVQRLSVQKSWLAVPKEVKEKLGRYR